MGEKKAARPTSNAVLVVFGLDDQGKHRAGMFQDEEIALGRKAAELLGLQFYEGEATKLKQVLKTLPASDIHRPGYGLLRRVRQAQYDAL